MPESNSQPTVHLLHGNDEFAMREYAQKLAATVNDDSQMAQVDIVRLDGRTISEETLQGAAYTIPFLNPRRLVELTFPTARIDPKDQAAHNRFITLLAGIPQTTRLVLLVEDSFERGKWRERERSKWLFNWAAGNPGACHREDFLLPKAAEMTGWLVREARKLGGEIAPPAAALLASHTGSDTRRAVLELEKLLIFVDFQRKIEADDVKAVAFPDDQVSVFQLVDAMSNGQGKQALDALRKLLDEEDAQMIMGMVIRQFRLLLLAREVVDAGGGLREIQQQVSDARNEYVAGKILGQVKHWRAQALEGMFRRLLALDRSIKSGGIAAEVALDLLVVEACQGARA